MVVLSIDDAMESVNTVMLILFIKTDYKTRTQKPKKHRVDSKSHRSG